MTPPFTVIMKVRELRVLLAEILGLSKEDYERMYPMYQNNNIA